jgi:hypothetical protein
MEGHAEMDMAVTDGSRTKRTLSREGRTAISHNFLMDWVSIWKDNRRRSTACRSARCLGPKGVLEGILFRVSSNLGEVLGGQSWGRWLRSPRSFVPWEILRQEDVEVHGGLGTKAFQRVLLTNRKAIVLAIRHAI